MDEIVSARDGLDLMMWRSKVADDFTLQEWHDFDGAIQELKYKIMANGEATGTEGIQGALFSRIDGETVRNVLVAGYQFGLARREAERREIVTLKRSQERVRAKDGDTEFARYLENVRKQQDLQIERLNEQIHEIDSIIDRRGLSDVHHESTPSVESVASSVTPTAGTAVAAMKGMAQQWALGRDQVS